MTYSASDFLEAITGHLGIVTPETKDGSDNAQVSAEMVLFQITEMQSLLVRSACLLDKVHTWWGRDERDRARTVDEISTLLAVQLAGRIR